MLVHFGVRDPLLLAGAGGRGVTLVHAYYAGSACYILGDILNTLSLPLAGGGGS